MKHKPFRKNNGKWSCSVCHWEFDTRPNKDNCPGLLRIDHATDDYKTEKQWLSLGYELIIPDGQRYIKPDAVAIVHSTETYTYYHRSHVREISPNS